MNKKVVYAIALTVFVGLVGCQPKFKKMANGMEYKVISSKKGDTLKYGKWFEFARYAVYTQKDSLLIPKEMMVNQIAQLDSVLFGPDAYQMFKTLRVGDSIIIRERTDSIIARSKKMGQPEMPWIKKGYYIIQSYTIKSFYSDSASLNIAQKRLSDEYMVKDSIFRIKQAKEDSIAATKQILEDDKVIKAFLAKNKITATKTAKGVYVEMITPGAGTITDSNGVLINYTGKNFAGKTFDSNVDPSFNHVAPYLVNMAQPEVIAGWVDGIKQLGKGAKARFYIPSALAYGKMGKGAESGIGPNENLAFDIEIVDVYNQAKTMQLQQQQAEEQQKQMMQQMQQQRQMQGQQQK